MWSVHARWWSPCTESNCLGISLLLGVMSCRISPLRGSRFNTFLAAVVSMILICFHRQGSTDRHSDTILFGIPVPLLQSFNLSLWKYQRGIKGGSRSVSHVALTIETSEPHASWLYLYTVISFRGITLEAHIALSQLKKQNVRVGATSEPANHSVDSAVANQSASFFVTLWRETSQGRVKVQD